MSLIVVVPFLVLGVFLATLWHRLAVAPRWPWPVRVAVALVLLALTALMLAGFDLWGGRWTPAQMRPWVWTGQAFMATALYLVLGLGLVWVVSIGIWLVRWRHEHGANARRRLNRVGSLLTVVAALGLTAWGAVLAARPTVTEYEVVSPALPPELDGTRVALVTDIHAGAVRSAGFTRRVVDLVRAEQPDLVVVAGDLVDGTADRYAAEIAPLADLSAPLGVYVTTGNHEMYRDTVGWVEAFEDLGLTVLRNESVTLERGGAGMTLVGVHDETGAGAFRPDYDAALAGVDPAGFTLMSAHQPVQALAVRGRGVDVQLSGHTHGGQLWPGRYLVPLEQPMVDGVAVVGDTTVVTSRGAGAWGPAVRVGADPEVPVVTLRRG